MSKQAKKKTLLIVDDNLILTELFDELFNELFNVRIAHSLAEALAELASNNIDAVICDYNLGIQNADPLITWVLEKSKSLINNFILITGETNLDLSHHKNTLSILHKPVEIETLLTTVEALFDKNKRLKA